MKPIKAVLAIGFFLSAALLYHSRPSTEEHRREEQFLKTCKEVFGLTQEECREFMERWGKFMNK